MADYEASFEGAAAPTRHRPSRVSSVDDALHLAPPSSAGTNDGRSKISKTSRRTVKKVVKSHTSSAPAPISEEENAHREDEAVGHVLGIGQVVEGHEDTTSRRKESAASSKVDAHVRHRRHSENSNSSRLWARPKRESLQRRGEKLAKHSNPSLVSVLSGMTQPSTANESNTTITERSHRDERRRKEKSSKGSKVQRRKRAETPSVADTDAMQSDVFQFLSESVGAQGSQADAQSVLQASSSSVTSSTDSRADDSKSSDASEGANDTPRTSPTSTRRSYSHGTSYYGQYNQKSGKPLYQSSFVHGPGDEEAEDSEAYSDDDSTYDGSHRQHSSQSAPHWNYPPPNPQSDNPHAPHPRQQQQQFAGHILQSPQPYYNVPYAGVMSPNTQPAVPFYDPRMYSGASPTNLSVTASQASARPSMPSYPPPLAIGYSPESAAAYQHHSPAVSHAMPMAVQSPTVAHANPAHHLAAFPQRRLQQRESLTDDTMIGYELLAHKLSELKKDGHNKDTTVIPAYRKFEQLNHRVLLHLQDEMSELEEELRQLDHDIAQASPGGQTGHHEPASRRGDAQYGNNLHRRRTDVLGLVYLKLEQYNRALSAFSNVKNLPSASPSDVDKYRAWMKQRNPIHEAESRFLERQADLMAFPLEGHTSIGHGVGTNQHTVMWLPLLPFVAFSIVPSLLGRIVVIALISAMGLRMVTSTPDFMAILTVREWMYAASIYFGLMAVLALFVR